MDGSLRLLADRTKLGHNGRMIFWANSFENQGDISFPVPISNSIGRWRAVSVSQEQQEWTRLASFKPAVVGVLDRVHADLSRIGSLDAEDPIRMPSFATALDLEYGVGNSIGLGGRKSSLDTPDRGE